MSPTWRRSWPFLAAVALALALYAPTLGYALLDYDDNGFVTAVPFVHDRSVANLADVFSRPVFGSYHPLHVASYGLDAALLGDRPLAFHAGNVLWYGVVVAAVVALARGLGRSALAAGVAGLVYAVHPAHVENVAWITARKDLLSGALGLLALALYLGGRPPSAARFAAALGLFALALLAKTVAGMLAVGLAAHALVEGRLDRREVARLLPFFVLTAVAFALQARAQATHGGLVPPYGGSWGLQARVALRASARYALLAVAPAPSSVRPPFPALGPLPGAWDLASLAVVALGLAGLARALFKRSTWAVPGVIFVAPLLPTSGIVPFPAFAQDRYLLLPTVGVALVAGDLFERALAARRRVALVALAAVVLGGGATVLVAERAWRSDVALWRAAAERVPDDLGARELLGVALLRANEREKGEQELRFVLARDPNAWAANLELGLRAYSAGRLEVAREHFERCGRSGSNQRFRTFALLARVALAQGDAAAADDALARALASGPRSFEVVATAGRVALARGRAGEALSLYDRALRDEPAWATAHLERAQVLRRLGRPGDARADLERARSLGAPAAELAALEAHLRLDAGETSGVAALLDGVPDTTSGLIARARLEARAGHLDAARAHVARAIAHSGPGARLDAVAEGELAPLLGP